MSTRRTLRCMGLARREHARRPKFRFQLQTIQETYTTHSEDVVRSAQSSATMAALADAAEARQVAEMRAALSDDLAAVRSGKMPDVTGDLRLLRFLRGYDNDVPKAVAATVARAATLAGD